MDGEEVWVAETWEAHGECVGVHGIYSSREAAWDGLKGHVDTLYVGDDGELHGKPRDDGPLWGRRWASAHPMKVQGRKGAQGT